MNEENTITITIDERAYGANEYIDTKKLKSAIIAELERQTPEIFPGDGEYFFEVTMYE